MAPRNFDELSMFAALLAGQRRPSGSSPLLAAPIHLMNNRRHIHLS
jgi:hypothetical protein